MRLTAVRHELVVGWFMAATLVVVAGGVAWTARTTPRITGRRFWVTVPHGLGVEPGSPVHLRGIRVGEADAIGFSPDGQVRFAVLVAAEYADVVRRDAVATVVPAPVLGTTKVELDPGVAAEPAAPEQALAAREGGSILDRVGRLEERLSLLVDRLDGLAAVTSEGVAEVRALLAKVDRGEGLVARALGDRALADDVAATASGARRAVERADAEVLPRLTRTLDEADARLVEGRELIAKLSADDGRLMTLLGDADAAVADARRALADARVGDTVAAVRSAVESVGTSAQGLADSARRATPTAEDARVAFEALRRAADALAQVAQELSRQPNAVIFGREPGLRR